MRKRIGYAALAVLGFLVLCLLLPSDPRARKPEELCGDGKRLMNEAGVSEDQAGRLACDHKAAKEAMMPCTPKGIALEGRRINPGGDQSRYA